MIILTNPPGRYNEAEAENNPPPKPPVRISTKHPQSMTSRPKKNDDAEKEVPTPTNTSATKPDTTTILEWTKVMRERPMVEPIQKYTQYSNNNKEFSNDDDEETVQVQPVKFEMFGIEPTPPPVEKSISPAMRTIKIKMKPIKKPIPTRVLNNYACFANDDDDDNNEDCVRHTEATNQAPTTGKSVQQLITKTMTSKGGNSDNDDNEDAAWVPPVTVEPSKL